MWVLSCGRCISRPCRPKKEDELPTVDPDGKTITIKYFRDKIDTWMKVLSVILNILGGSSTIGFVYLVARLADALMLGDNYIQWIIYMVLTCLFLGGSIGLATFLSEWSAERQLLCIRKKFLHEVMRQDMGYFDSRDATALSGRLLDNTRLVRDLIGIRSSMASVYSGITVAGLVRAFYTSVQMAAVSLSVVPVIVIAGWYAGRLEISAKRKSGAATEAADSVALETIESVRTIKAFDIHTKIVKLFQDSLDVAYNVSKKAGCTVALGYAVYWLLMFCSAAFGFWYGAKFLKSETNRIAETCDRITDPTIECEVPPSASQLISCFCNVLLAAFFIGKILPWFADLRLADYAIRETVALYTSETLVDPYDDSGIKTTDKLRGEITFENVAFKYPSREVAVFDNLNLTIPASRSLALVGPSGCGKSTVIQLIFRFYNADRGRILLDGVPISDYNIKALRSSIAWVAQEPKLFAVSIAENIRIGRPGATDEEIIEVCKRVNAHDFIDALPEKYNTWVGDGGGQLSGGQKQRIAIARAVISRPKILILDEATSALDNTSEKIVQDTIDDIVRDSKITTIIIAHRLSTVRNADRIVVLSHQAGSVGSSVVEAGTHEELSAIPNGIYAALVAVQSSATDKSDIERDKILEGRQQEDARMIVNSRNSSNLRGGSTGKNFQYSGSNIDPRHFSSTYGDVLGTSSAFCHSGSRTDFALPYDRAQSLFFNAGYSPPRLFSRTAQPIQVVVIPFIVTIISSVVFNCMWPLFGSRLGSFIKVYVQSVNGDRLMSDARRQAFNMMLIGACSFLACWALKTFGTLSAVTVAHKMRHRGFVSILNQEIGFFDQSHRSPGRLANVLGYECNLLGDWTISNLAVWIGTAGSLLLGIGICLSANIRLGLVAIAAACFLVPISYIGSTLVTSGGSLKFWSGEPDKLAVLTGDLAVQVTEVVLNIRTVTAYQMQSYCEAEYEQKALEIFYTGRRRAILAGITNGLINICRLGSFTLVIYYGAKLVEWNEIDASLMIQGVMAFFLAGLQCGRTLAGTVPWALGKSAARSVWTVIDRKPLIDDHAEGLECEAIDKIEFDHVAFKYPTRPNLLIFRNVSYIINRGESVALVGPSGCGKSTSVQLIQRFYDVLDLMTSQGRSILRVNGRDIRDYDLASLRGMMGYVPQEPKLFTGTIRENIFNGSLDPNVSEQDVQDACVRANAWTFIQEQPQGLDTDVGRGGARLSGGQKQRIAIARALIRRPHLLILDEATSALDAESERVVQAALNELLASRQFTSLIIAHRLSTIRSCDKIVVFVNDAARGSRIAEVGDHASLMQLNGGVYKGLIRIAEGEPQH